MFRCSVTPVWLRRSGVIALALTVGMLSAPAAFAQAAGSAAQPGAAPAQAAPPTKRVFASDAGMVLNFIKPDKTADFEAVMAKLKEALQKSDKPERKQQAASWKIFKNVDPMQPGQNALYIMVIEPPVKDADYTVSTILAEGFTPADVNKLYETYAGSIAQGLNFLNLGLVSDLGK